MTDENQTPNPPKKLTLSDPVPAEILSRLGELDEAKIKVAIQFLELEQARMQRLAAAHQIEQEYRRLFESILMERGLAPNAQDVSLDSKTGVLEFLNKPVEPPTEQPK